MLYPIGSMVLLYMVTFTIIYPNVSIYAIHGSYGYCIIFYHVLSYSIVFYRVLSCSIMFYNVLSCCNCCNTCMFRHQNPFFARLSFRSTSSFRPSPLRSLSFPLYQKRKIFQTLCQGSFLPSSTSCPFCMDWMAS